MPRPLPRGRGASPVYRADADAESARRAGRARDDDRRRARDRRPPPLYRGPRLSRPASARPPAAGPLARSRCCGRRDIPTCAASSGCRSEPGSARARRESPAAGRVGRPGRVRSRRPAVRARRRTCAPLRRSGLPFTSDSRSKSQNLTRAGTQFCHLVSGVKRVDNRAMTKTSMLLRALAAAVFLSCINAVTLAQSNKVDVTGVWIFTVESPAGKSNPTLTFKQDGEKLTGQYSSQL